MADTDPWLEHFQQAQQQIRFRFLYWCSMGGLLLGFLGLLWALPVPRELTEISPALNWGSVFLMAALVYYFIISVPLAIGMLPVIVGMVLFEVWLESLGTATRPVAAGLTLAGVAGLYASHHARGGFGALRRDIQLLMIAPLWLLALAYRRLGIPH